MSDSLDMSGSSPTNPRLLDRNQLLAALGPAEHALLLPHLKELPLELGQVLQRAEARVHHVWFPLVGMISLMSLMKSGEAIETAVVGREGAVDAFAGLGPWHAFSQAVVQVPGRGLVISAAQFQEIALGNERIRNLILRFKETLLAQVQQSAACNALHSLECRMARWLLQADDRNDSSRLALTQDGLSQMLGVRRTSVTATAAKLQSMGLIRQRRGSIELLDREGLERTACECYATLRQRFLALSIDPSSSTEVGGWAEKST